MKKAPFLNPYAVFYLLFLYAPILLLPIFAFNDSAVVAFPLSGFTTKWFDGLWNNPPLHQAVKNSLIIASVSVVISVGVSSLAAYAFSRMRFVGKQALFFFLLGGVPLAAAYKMVNTLDSMVGYKNERYYHFGKVSARLDDGFNFVPARVSVPLIALAAQILSGSGIRSLKTAWSEGGNHTSPNAGRPEAAFAGALQVKLNGPNTYGGILVKKPYIGVRFGAVRIDDIKKACDLMMLCSLFSVGLSTALASGFVSG